MLNSRAMNDALLAELRRLDGRTHLHPFTDHAAMHQRGTHVMESGSGCVLVDETGRRLLDGLAGLWCVNVGYGRREIVAAVAEQMTKLSFYCSFFETTTEPTIRVAAWLAERAPGRLERVFFTNSGSEANESALKIIRAWQKLRGRSSKHKILSRTFSYHGVGIATTSLTGLPNCTDPFDLPLPGFVRIPGPYTYASGTGLDDAAYGAWCIEETERVIEREGADTIAAMFVEPVQGAGGVILPPEGYLGALRELCRRHDILFVADEVITAFGRLGTWFASELWDLDPDIMTVAQGLTSGYLPLGATLVSGEIATALETNGYFAHGFTYSGHPVPAAAALANLAILESEDLPGRVRNDVGPYFQNKLQALRADPLVGETRGLGLIGAIELRVSPEVAAPGTAGARAAALAREEGVIVRGIRDLIAISPPLVISRDEIDRLFAAIGRVIDRLRG